MPQELTQLDTHKRFTRIVLILFLLLAAVWSYYACRWYIGNTLAEYFNSGDNNLDLARAAQRLAPGDPLTNWRLAQVSQKSLPLDQAAASLADYEKAVALAPGDYRFWVTLGTAREQTGDAAGAEQAFRQAVSLAPAYAYPHWNLGNVLIRNGRYDEAFAELRSAATAAPEELRPQMFNLILQVYGNDFESIKKAVGDNSETRATFALYLLDQRKIDEGLAIWNSLSVAEKKANKEAGLQFITALVRIPRFHDALSAWNDLESTPGDRAEMNKITDGSFEEIIGYRPETIFGWQVKNPPQVQIGIDPNVSHSGSRSLRLVFQVRSQLDAMLTSQLVPVEKDTNYDFECYVKTAKLQTGGPTVVQIIDANSGALIAASDGAPTGDSDWSRIGLTFKTSEKTEAITVKIVRAPCGDANADANADAKAAICPIFGTVWYDDFNLNRRN